MLLTRECARWTPRSSPLGATGLSALSHTGLSSTARSLQAGAGPLCRPSRPKAPCSSRTVRRTHTSARDTTPGSPIQSDRQSRPVRRSTLNSVSPLFWQRFWPDPASLRWCVVSSSLRHPPFGFTCRTQFRIAHPPRSNSRFNLGIEKRDRDISKICSRNSLGSGECGPGIVDSFHCARYKGAYKTGLNSDSQIRLRVKSLQPN
jgi:hypothetical protein